MSQISKTEYSFWAYTKTAPTQNHQYLWPAVLAQLRKNGRVASGTRLLDAGCGNGSFCQVLNDNFDIDVSGFDLSESGIRLAQEHAPDCRFEQFSAYDSFTDAFGASFDVIVSIEVIEHLYDPSTFLSRVHEALTPEGLFVLTTPFHGYLKNLAIALSGECDAHYTPLQAGGHIKFWSRRTIVEILEREGFEIELVSGVGRFPLLWKSMLVTARPIHS